MVGCMIYLKGAFLEQKKVYKEVTEFAQKVRNTGAPQSAAPLLSPLSMICLKEPTSQGENAH